MIVLKNTLGKDSRIYNIYTDSSPRYVCGSAGIAFYEGKFVLAIRQSSNIPVGGRPHYDYRFIRNHTAPYLNKSICRIGYISPKDLDRNPIYLETSILDIVPSGDKAIFKGLEDPRLAAWGGNLYVYGTQYTESNPEASDIMCYPVSGGDPFPIPGPTSVGIPDIRVPEKNWMTIPGDNIDFIYGIYPGPSGLVPLLYSDIMSGDFRSADMSAGISYRGSAPPIPTQDGYACIVHESYIGDRGLSYQHRIAYIDKYFGSATVSEPFLFEQPGIEFTTGWCLDGKDNLYISYSTTDGTTNLLVTTLSELFSVLSGKEFGKIDTNPRKIAGQLYADHPMESSQYYWKDWMQNSDRDSLYSHYAILLYYLDRYLLPDTLEYLEEDNSIDALVLKIYHHRRMSRDFNIYYNMIKKLPENWRNMIDNQYIKKYNFEKFII